MPLASAYPIMEKAITDAYMTLLAEGQKDGADAEKLMKDLAKALAKAVHDYTMSAQVITTTSGMVVGTAAPIAPTGGAAPVFGSSTGSGNGNLA